VVVVPRIVPNSVRGEFRKRIEIEGLLVHLVEHEQLSVPLFFNEETIATASHRVKERAVD
jgi:hypothetical protein